MRSQSGEPVPAARLLRQPEVRLEDLVEAGSVSLEISNTAARVDLASLETAVKYEGYLKRQTQEVAKAKREERRRIPEDFCFDRIPGLSREVVQRLSQVRPGTLGQALRVPGVTPAAVAVISAHLSKRGHSTAENGMIEM